MCGFLLYPDKPRRDVLLTHLSRQKHRGTDGFGAISLKFPTPNSVRSTKDLNLTPFLNKFAHPPRGPIMIHHRKASVGGIKEELVHPLVSRDKKVTVMHNGTRRELSELFYEASDTKAIAEMWNHVDDEALYCMLEGCGIVITLDQGRLWFHRDDKRTLYKCTEGTMAGMYASEPVDAGFWALVDEYPLVELPLNMADWQLEHGTPLERTLKKCALHNCDNYYAGIGSGYRCHSCESRFSSGYNQNYGHGRRGGVI